MSDLLDVHTKIPKEYKMRALIHDISFKEALCNGIDLMTDSTYNDKIKCLKALKEKKNEVRLFERRLVELNKKEEEIRKLEEQRKKQKEALCPLCSEILTKENTRRYGGKIFCSNCLKSGSIPSKIEVNK